MKDNRMNELSHLGGKNRRKQIHRRESKKREAQVNVRLTPEFYKRLQKACELNEHKEGQLCRILIEWALPFYERSESVKAFKAITDLKTEVLPIKPAIVTSEDMMAKLEEIARQISVEQKERSA